MKPIERIRHVYKDECEIGLQYSKCKYLVMSVIIYMIYFYSKNKYIRERGRKKHNSNFSNAYY